MQAAAIMQPDPAGLAPMQCHGDVLVVPSQGQNLKLMVGGPIWANWDAAVLARHRRDGVVADNQPQNRPAVETLMGDHVWGGQLIPHFGHLIAEQVTRLAQSAQDRPGDPALFILQKNMGPHRVPGFVWDVLTWLGYPRPQIRIVDCPVTVQRLWAAPQAEMLGGIAPPDEYLDLLERNAAARALRPVSADLVYVSRARLTKPQAGRFLGEAYLCATLAQVGVSVCYPETLPLPDQLAIFAGARHLIFAEGSALHGRQLLGRHDQKISVLNRRPGWRTGEAALKARAQSVEYHDICPEILTPKTEKGDWAMALGASLLDEAALLAVFGAADVPLAKVWNAQAFRASVEADLRLWLAATFGGSVVLIDQEASGAVIDRQLQERGLAPLDHWLAGVTRGAKPVPPAQGARA